MRHAGEDGQGRSHYLSEALAGMECLLTAMVVDESGWCASWVKFLDFVLENSRAPTTLREVGLDVPRKLEYMMDSNLGEGEGVKAEKGAEGSQDQGCARADGQRAAPATV